MNKTTHFRKIITITAEDSPNVQYARTQLELGIEPTGEIVIPGVLPWDDFVHRLRTWDEIRQEIGLYARFYKGAQVLMYPPHWIDLAHLRNNSLPPVWERKAEAIGIDPGEGVDPTAMYAIDSLGILEKVSEVTPDTNKAYQMMKGFIKHHKVDPAKVCIDVGGGGREHAHRMRSEGMRIRAIGFGEKASVEPKRGYKSSLRKLEDKEVGYEFRNRRAEIYFMIRQMIDPALGQAGFAIPSHLTTLRKQMSVIPLLYDSEGRIYLPPKNKKSADSTEKTLREMLGCSPDEADALALAVFALKNLKKKRRIGVLQ